MKKNVINIFVLLKLNSVNPNLVNTRYIKNTYKFKGIRELSEAF